MTSECENIEQYVDESFDRMMEYLAATLDGGARLQDWQEAMVVELRRLHTQMAALGKGGWDSMTQADWGRVGRHLRDEYAWLRNFAKDIESGSLSRGQIITRMGMYAEHAQMSCWGGQSSAAAELGATHESRHLNAGESCEDCVGYAAQGIVPLGTLPEPGLQSRCKANCKCGKRYYKLEGGEYVEVV